jgi:hypothetical protein
MTEKLQTEKKKEQSLGDILIEYKTAMNNMTLQAADLVKTITPKIGLDNAEVEHDPKAVEKINDLSFCLNNIHNMLQHFERVLNR